MPHWACHYYRLETGSSFVVGSWEFSRLDSLASMAVYTALIVLNVLSIQWTRFRVLAALGSGFGHIILGTVHAIRLAHPFKFEVFSHPWSKGASLREAIIVLGFGLLSIGVAGSMRRVSSNSVLGVNDDLKGNDS